MKGRSVLALVTLALEAATLAVACAPEPPPMAATSVPARPAAASDASIASAPVHVQILAFNDFHGTLEPPSGSGGAVVAPSGDGGTAVVPAGGAAYLATHLKRLKAENPNTVIVSAGDLTGASPLLSNLFKDEPSVLVMNRIGLDFEGVGNHDFDRGLDALVRLQQGDGDGGFPGASFRYLAANVENVATHRTVFPPYAIRELGGVKVAFIGETLAATPTVSVPSSVNGLSFGNEVATVNALVPELKKADVSAIVLVLHQGGFQGKSGTYDSCEGFAGEIVPLLAGDPDAGRPGLSPAVDVVVSGHTHQAYDCVVDGRLVTSAASFGRLVTKIDLVVDPVGKRVIDKHAKNVIVTRDVPPDPDVARIVETYKAQALPVMSRVVGYVKADLGGNAKVLRSASCETPLGDLLADAQLAGTQDAAKGKADVAFMNPGGIRADLLAKGANKADFVVTYAEAFAVQPFGNGLVTMTLTGGQIVSLLKMQFGRDRPRVLQVSNGFSYTYAYDPGTRAGVVDPRSIRLHGKSLDLAKAYRVTVNSFLASGGDDFAVLKEGTDRVDGGVDVDALTRYLGKMSSATAPLAASPGKRIVGNGCR